MGRLSKLYADIIKKTVTTEGKNVAAVPLNEDPFQYSIDDISESLGTGSGNQRDLDQTDGRNLVELPNQGTAISIGNFIGITQDITQRTFITGDIDATEGTFYVNGPTHEEVTYMRVESPTDIPVFKRSLIPNFGGSTESSFHWIYLLMVVLGKLYTVYPYHITKWHVMRY